jgi:MoaA/NifB/PqqE/SkfB family radical SAM enzyme
MIKLGKSLGYRVCTNTTIFRETDMDEIEQMLAYLDSLGVDGMLLSPGYHYEVLPEKHFLFRHEVNAKFKRVLELSKKYKFYSTPLFLEFAAGLVHACVGPFT